MARADASERRQPPVDPAARAARRRRRRKRRAGAVASFAVIALGLAWFFESQATTTVIVTRYAETEQDGSDDPGLSPTGWRRAEELSRMLGDVDVVAGVDVIFATRLRRTQETAEPLSRLLNVPVQLIDAEDIVGLSRRLITEYKGRIVLVVTNEVALPRLVAELHGSKKLPVMGPGDHEDLYLLSIPWFGKVKTLRIRYGLPAVAAAR